MYYIDPPYRPYPRRTPPYVYPNTTRDDKGGWEDIWNEPPCECGRCPTCGRRYWPQYPGRQYPFRPLVWM